jgi:hypothetical protein
VAVAVALASNPQAPGGLGDGGHAHPQSTGDAPTLYRCKDSGGSFAVERMTESTKRGRVYVFGRCLPCNRPLRRGQEHRLASADRGADGSLVEPISVPTDPVPELLRAMLAADRARGLRFEDVFDEDIDFATRAACRSATAGVRRCGAPRALGELPTTGCPVATATRSHPSSRPI